MAADLRRVGRPSRWRWLGVPWMRGKGTSPGRCRGLPEEQAGQRSSRAFPRSPPPQRATGPRLVVLLVVVAAQRQPVLGARRRLGHRPTVALADVMGEHPVVRQTVAEVVLGSRSRSWSRRARAPWAGGWLG